MLTWAGEKVWWEKIETSIVHFGCAGLAQPFSERKKMPKCGIGERPSSLAMWPLTYLPYQTLSTFFSSSSSLHPLAMYRLTTHLALFFSSFFFLLLPSSSFFFFLLLPSSSFFFFLLLLPSSSFFFLLLPSSSFFFLLLKISKDWRIDRPNLPFSFPFLERPPSLPKVERSRGMKIGKKSPELKNHGFFGPTKNYGFFF